MCPCYITSTKPSLRISRTFCNARVYSATDMKTTVPHTHRSNIPKAISKVSCFEVTKRHLESSLAPLLDHPYTHGDLRRKDMILGPSLQTNFNPHEILYIISRTKLAQGILPPNLITPKKRKKKDVRLSHSSPSYTRPTQPCPG